MLLKEFNYKDKQDLLGSDTGKEMTFAIEIEMEFDETKVNKNLRKKYPVYIESLYSSRNGRNIDCEFKFKEDSRICREVFLTKYYKFKKDVQYNYYINDFFTNAATDDSYKLIAMAIPVFIKNINKDNWPFFIDEHHEELLKMNNDDLIKFLKKSYEVSPTDLINILIALNNIKYDNLFKELVADRTIKNTFKYEEGYDFAKSFAEIYFKDFIKKYDLKLEFDSSLKNGVEMKPNNYIKGIIPFIEYVQDFYNLFKKPECPFFFDATTGMHVNIGYEKDIPIDWNILKLFFFLGESTYNFNSPGYAYNFNRDRYEGVYAKPWKKNMFNHLLNAIKEVEYFFGDAFSQENIYLLNTVSNKFRLKSIEHASHYFSLDLEKLAKKNYIEFRYLGDIISFETLIQKSLYYAYLIRLASDETYKQEEFKIKYIKFINKAKSMRLI